MTPRTPADYWIGAVRYPDDPSEPGLQASQTLWPKGFATPPPCRGLIAVSAPRQGRPISDVWHHSGTLSTGLKIEEVWERCKKQLSAIQSVSRAMTGGESCHRTHSYSPNNREMTVHDEQGVHYIDMRNVSEVLPRSPADASPKRGMTASADGPLCPRLLQPRNDRPEARSRECSLSCTYAGSYAGARDRPAAGSTARATENGSGHQCCSSG